MTLTCHWPPSAPGDKAILDGLMIVLGSGVLPSLSYTPTTMVPGEIEGDELDAELSEYVPFT